VVVTVVVEVAARKEAAAAAVAVGHGSIWNACLKKNRLITQSLITDL